MTRPFVLGIDCRLYMQTVAQRTATPPVNPYVPANAANYTELTTVQDVTLNLTASTADLTSRNSNGWRQMVSVLKDGSADFSVLWQPDDPIFTDLLNFFLDQCPTAFLILDGPNTGISIADPDLRCGASGVVTGLHADFIVNDFTRNESLEEGLTADVSIQPALGVIFPEWVDPPLPTIA